MAECPWSRSIRGTRSQFRLGMTGFGQNAGFHPVHLGDIMDAGQSSQTGIVSSRDLVSPSRRTHTLTVREYEETISNLNKENFDLKLKLFLYNETMKKSSCKDKDSNLLNKDPIEVIVELKSDIESLKVELCNKDKLLQDAVEKAEKYEDDFKQLEKKCIKLQTQLASLSELPSKEEYLALVEEKENLVHHTEYLEKTLTEKEQEIDEINQKIEILAEQNRILEEKLKKRSLAIQSFIYKNYKEKEMLPDELRTVVISATQAAKNRNKEELVTAVKTIHTTLNKIMSSVQTLKSEGKENIENSQAKCLKEEFLEKSHCSLPNQNETYVELNHLQSLKEILVERNTPETKHLSNLNSSVHESFVKGKVLSESSVNIAERDVIDYFNAPSITTENLTSFSSKQDTQSSVIGEHNLINIETVCMPSASPDLLPEKDLSKSEVISVFNRSSEVSHQLIDVLKENEKLKLEVEEKLSIIQNLKDTCRELELKKMLFKEKNGVPNASKQYSVYTQTDITGYNLLNGCDMAKLQKNAELSSNVEELQEYILRLLLAIEDKNNELSNVKQSLFEVQEDLKKALNTTNALDKDYYMNERNELHERLALSCAVNEELLKHLKNLEAFMEELLQNKLNISTDSISQFINYSSKCLNESLKLSHALSDHLSYCEGSKLFEECESLLSKNESSLDERNFFHLDALQLNTEHPVTDSRTHFNGDFIPFEGKDDHRMNKVSDGSQLGCYWQQLNPYMKSEISHQTESNIIHKATVYPSSESDIWSEPDRNISMQRIGISLQNSPVSSKSPRKLRIKEKKMSSRLSSDQDTSSIESRRLSKKRQGPASRRLFFKEIKNQDFASERFYLLLAEKYSKLKSLYEDLQSTKDENISVNMWADMYADMASLEKALQKLHIAKENAKDFPSAICGKCVMLELFADLMTSHKESDFNINDSPSFIQEMLQKFLEEIHLLKEACKEPFLIFSEVIEKRSQLTQSDDSNENENKINELENVVIDLNGKNKELGKNLDDVKKLLDTEREMLNSVRSENSKLLNQLDHMEKELSAVKQKEKELSLKNAELIEKIESISQNNSELIIEKKSQHTQSSDLNESENTINELKKVIHDLGGQNKELNKKLDNIKELLSAERKMLESVKTENTKLTSQIHDLKEELLNLNQKEKEISLKNEALVQELSIVNKNNSELNSILKEFEKKDFNTALDKLTTELERNKLELVNMSKKCLEYENELNQQISEKEQYQNKLKTLEHTSLAEKEKKLTEINKLNADKYHHLKELENIKQEKLTLENENAILNNNLKTKDDELISLEETVKRLQETKETLHCRCTELQIELENAKESVKNLQEKCSSFEEEILTRCNQIKAEYTQQLKQFESQSLSEKQRLTREISALSNSKDAVQKLKNENAQLLSQINCLKEELSDTKGNERELSLRNEELVKELTKINKNNSELNYILKNLEEKEKDLNTTLDHLTSELQKNKLDLADMSKRCLQYENELNQEISMKEECENKLRTLEHSSQQDKKEFISQINDLSADKHRCLKELENLKKEKSALENEIVILNNNLKSKESEVFRLEETIKRLQEAREILNGNCTKLCAELEEAKKYIEDLQRKCSSFEGEILAKCKKVEAESLEEKQRLITEISVLKNERENIIEKLKNEREIYEKLMKENEQLNKKYSDSCQEISSLKLKYEELKNEQLKLIQKNAFFEKALHSSNSECNILNQDLKQLRETLQNLESKCLLYEKELVSGAGMKNTLVDCLLKIINELSSRRQNINEICKAYGNENNFLEDEFFDYIPVIDEDNIQKLSENLINESKKLILSVDSLIAKLQNFYLKTLEAKTSQEKLKTSSKQQTEFHKTEIEHLKSQNDNFQQTIDEMKKSIVEKEKSAQLSSYEIQSLKEKLENSEKEIERSTQLLKRKEDEITMLQERICNLQSFINSIIETKSEMFHKTTSFDKKFVNLDSKDSVFSDNQLSSQTSKKASKMCQTNEYEDSSHMDDSFSSTGTLEGSKSSCCEKYWKKCYSLQTKLALRKKHIEILEKEKNDMRENFLQQLQEKTDPLEKDSTGRKIAELESVLEKKKAFINELKGELLKTCNSLIDKEKQLDILKDKLSEYEKKSKYEILDKQDKHSILTDTVSANIKTLKNHKWNLIQTIFEIQKRFYEKRGIHLNYFENFKDHVNNLYSMQLTQTFSKSESMPLLGSYAEKLQYDHNDRLKHIVGLELDIECLENLKIFLNRFFVPYILQKSQTDIKSLDLEKKTLSDELKLKAENESPKVQKTDILDISLPEFNLLHVNSFQEKTVSFENFASKVSYYLDCIENFYNVISMCQQVEDFDASSKDCTDQDVKSLLLRIIEEIKVLQKSSVNLFHLNSLLKNFDFIVTSSFPVISNRSDSSDKESLLSEETITVSRTESPLSFEEACPIKLPPPDALKLEEKSLKPHSLGNRLEVVEPYCTKVNVIGSSCDSLCQRSHYSSPDLGIESDPNHDSSAPEQKEEGIEKYQRRIFEEQKFLVKAQQKTAFTSTESAGRFSGHKFGETLYAIGNLQQYELLKKEVKESLIAIKSVLSRTGDGLHHVAKYTSPRKTLEYNTLKSIKYTCEHIEVCLKTANDLVGKFWIGPCPSEKEWKFLNDENQVLSEQLAELKSMIQKQESEFKKAMGKLEHAQVVKASMEKKISKKLVKTKKVIRQAEFKLLENRCQNFPPVPKYPSEQIEKSPHAKQMQQM